MSKKKQHICRVFGIDVSKLVHSDNGHNNRIKPEEYKHSNDYKPSRNIRLIYKDETINLAVCDDVPKRPRPDNGPVAPADRRCDDGRSKGSQKLTNPYESMPLNMFARWDDRKQVLVLNSDHKFVKTYFMCDKNFIQDSPRHRRSLELYASWSTTAFSLSQAYDKASLFTKVINEEVGDDPLNFLINQVLHAQIASDPLMIKQIERIDKLLGNNIEEEEEEV